MGVEAALISIIINIRMNFRKSVKLSLFFSNKSMAEYYRADGVRITHDPYAPGMMEKYGKPGETDNEGFDPYRDTVGPGIYGGCVVRDKLGRVKIGKQYQNHNPRPGPIYSGGGYSPVVERADPTFQGYIKSTPLEIAESSRSFYVINVLKQYMKKRHSNNIYELYVDNAEVVYKKPVSEASNSSHSSREHSEVALINGKYVSQLSEAVPSSFKIICAQQGWEPLTMWERLNGNNNWYKHEENESYIYLNKSDGKWWIDGPSGLGVFTTQMYQSTGNAQFAVPNRGWQFLGTESEFSIVLPPMLRIFRKIDH